MCRQAARQQEQRPPKRAAIVGVAPGLSGCEISWRYGGGSRAPSFRSWLSKVIGRSKASVGRAVTTSTDSPLTGTFSGKIDGLPDVAKSMLNFRPVDEPDQTDSDTILERVASVCGLDDYIGSDEFPGTMLVSPPRALGWVRVTWKPGKCGGIAGGVYSAPTLVFDVSADHDHLRPIGGVDSATYFLTHQ